MNQSAKLKYRVSTDIARTTKHSPLVQDEVGRHDAALDDLQCSREVGALQIGQYVRTLSK